MKRLVAVLVMLPGIALAQTPQLEAVLRTIPAGDGWYQVNPTTGKCDPVNTNPRGLFRWGSMHGYDVGNRDFPNMVMGTAEEITFGLKPFQKSILLVKPFGACEAFLSFQQRNGVIPGRD